MFIENLRMRVERLDKGRQRLTFNYLLLICLKKLLSLLKRLPWTNNFCSPGLIFITLVCINTRVLAQKELDSRLLDTPEIQCGEARIKVSIRTNDPFGGNVYAKGFFSKEVCRVKGNGIGNSANITIPVNADCGMRRRRIANPKGLVLEMTVVLMFHPKFLTRNDKAYHIECMYVEVSQKVTNRLDISALPSTEISERIGLSETNLPKCIYEVLNNDENGHAISFATIGQPVYHRWTCRSRTTASTSSKNGVGEEESPPAERLYCLTVHSCEVDDGQGNVQKLLDSNGCSLDKTLLDEIEYKSDLEAGRKGFVFRFADRPTLYFGCQLRLELKNEWNQVCKRTSENCRALAALSAQQPSVVFQNSQSMPDPTRPSTADNPLEPVYSTPLPAQWKPNRRGSPTAQEVALSGGDTLPTSDNDPEHRLTANGGSGGQIPLDQLTVNGDEEDEEEQEEDDQETTNNESSQGVLGYLPTTSSTLSIKRRTRSSTFHADRSSAATPSHRSAVDANPSISLKDYSPQSQPVESERYSKKTTRLISPSSLEAVRISDKRASALGVATAEQTSRSAFVGQLPSVDLDVTAREVDVLDIPRISMEDQGGYSQRESRPFARDFLEPIQQICVSRQTLSVSIFGAILLLLLIITLFCCALFRLKSAPTTGVLPRVTTTTRSRCRSGKWSGKHNVLNAYSA